MALRRRGLAWALYRRLLALTVTSLFSLIALLFTLTAAPVYATSVTSSDSNKAAELAIQSTISGQIKAFARDDAKAAFSFAAPSIQRQFGTPDRFMMMVLRGYPMVYRPSSIEFLDASPNGTGAVMQSVRISDAGGKVWIAFYNMRLVSKGEWRIAGVRMREVETKVI